MGPSRAMGASCWSEGTNERRKSMTLKPRVLRLPMYLTPLEVLPVDVASMQRPRLKSQVLERYESCVT